MEDDARRNAPYAEEFFGPIVFVSFLGLAMGAAIGALAGKMGDYGIDDDFIKTVCDQIIMKEV